MLVENCQNFGLDAPPPPIVTARLSAKEERPCQKSLNYPTVTALI